MNASSSLLSNSSSGEKKRRSVNDNNRASSKHFKRNEDNDDDIEVNTARAREREERRRLANEHLVDQLRADILAMNACHDTRDALTFLRAQGSSAVNDARRPQAGAFSLPCVIYQHQVYALVPNRTRVDRDIEAMRGKNEVMFHFARCFTLHAY